MADDPLAVVSIRYFDHARVEAIEVGYAHGGTERIDGSAGYAAELARKAGLTSVVTPDATRLWVADPDGWEPRQ